GLVQRRGAGAPRALMNRRREAGSDAGAGSGDEDRVLLEVEHGAAKFPPPACRRLRRAARPGLAFRRGLLAPPAHTKELSSRNHPLGFQIGIRVWIFPPHCMASRRAFMNHFTIVTF